MLAKSSHQQGLDSGSSSRRESRSSCKCLFWTIFLLGGMFCGGIVFIIGNALRAAISQQRFPHKGHYHDSSSEALPGSVVRPLVDKNQLFDIAVTVWIRAPAAEEEEYRGKKKAASKVEKQASDGQGSDKLDAITEQGTDDVFPLTITTSGGDLMDDEDILEKPIYSDIAFRGLRLTDQGISTSINFTIPTARFLGARLQPDDLRGSVVLIPTSPSPLDHLKNYSSWIPESVKVPQRRSWPFPLGSHSEDGMTLADRALDSFGFSIPLVEFHETQSVCSHTSFNSTGERGTRDSKGDDRAGETATIKPNANNEDEGDDEDISSEIKKIQSLIVPQPVYKRHPYVVTRTQLRMVDETGLFNRKAYNKAHNTLKAHACGRPFMKPSRRLCIREYKTNGHWETRLQLETPVPGNGTDVQSEWAYSPFLNYNKNAAGPLDLVPVPVSRENCSNAANETSGVATQPELQGEAFMNITWRISFSGRSAGKIAMADKFNAPVRVQYNESDSKKVMMQETAELQNAFFGYRFHDDAHPRRRLAIGTIRTVGPFVLIFVDLHYWYTRTSTAFISIPGSALMATSMISSEIVHGLVWLWDVEEAHRTFFCFVTLVVIIVGGLPGFATIKAILRLEVRWYKTWVPTVRRATATHRERASARLDARTDWRLMGGLFFSLVAVYYFLAPHDRSVIASRVPPSAEHEYPPNNLRDYSPVLLYPMDLTGVIFQLLLNHRARTFAGEYRVSALLKIALCVVKLSVFLPVVVGGRYDARIGLSAHNLVDLVTLAAMAWQAATLPVVPQMIGDEDEE